MTVDNILIIGGSTERKNLQRNNSINEIFYIYLLSFKKNYQN